VPVKRRALPDLMLAVADRALPAFEQGGKTSLAVRQRQRQQIATVEMQQVEDEIDEVGTARISGSPHGSSRSSASW
jgi:hypothetical protein